MTKPIIHLWDTVGFGVIVDYPTGIYISNQTGGTACFHPMREGFYLPLANELLLDNNHKFKKLHTPELELWDYFEAKYRGTGATNGLDDEDVIFFNQLLKSFNLNNFLEIELNLLKQSHEAWVYVKIHNNVNDNRANLLQGFPKQLTGVMTWNNSD